MALSPILGSTLPPYFEMNCFSPLLALYKMTGAKEILWFFSLLWISMIVPEMRIQFRRLNHEISWIIAMVKVIKPKIRGTFMSKII
jgi:hypothetical protein